MKVHQPILTVLLGIKEQQCKLKGIRAWYWTKESLLKIKSHGQLFNRKHYNNPCMHMLKQCFFWQLAQSTLPVPKQRWKWACIQPFWTQRNFNLPTLILNYWNNCIHETNLHNQTETINSANCVFQVHVKERNAMIKERQVTIQKERRSIALRLGPNLRAIAPLRTQNWIQICLPFIKRS